MKKLLIPLLGASALLGGCHTTGVRTSVAVPVGVVEHRHLHEEVVVVHRRDEMGHEEHHRPAYGYPPSRVVVVNPAPVVQQTQLTLEYYGGGGMHRDSQPGHQPPRVIVGRGRNDDGNRDSAAHSDHGRRAHGAPSQGHRPSTSSHRGSGDGATPPPRGNDRPGRPSSSPQTEGGAKPQPQRQQVAEGRSERPAPAAKGGGKAEAARQGREAKATARGEQPEETSNGHGRSEGELRR